MAGPYENQLGLTQLPKRPENDAYQLKPEEDPVTTKPNANAKLGQGGRFAALKSKLGKEKGVDNPGALAAYIGRQRYGKEAFQKMAAKGKS